MNNDASTLALIAILGTVVTALFKLLNDNTKALGKVAEASNTVATATTDAAKEAKDRNGHLGDQNLQIVKLVSSQNKDIRTMKETGQKNYQANSKIANILSKSAIIAAEDRDTLISNSQTIEHQDVQSQIIHNSEEI